MVTSVWFDSHCHLDDAVFDDDRTQVIDDARALGVERIFVPGVSLERWQRLKELRRDYAGVAVGIGLHPYFIGRGDDSERDLDISSIAKWCSETNAVAVGECGVDGLFAKRGGVHLERQARIFERHIEAAVELSLPLVVHVVRAHGLALSILRRYRLPRGGVVHAFSGSAEIVRDYAGLGFYFGFGGAVTRDRAERARKALDQVPLDRLLLETDAPDQAPEGFYSRNEPRALPQIAKDIARLRNTDVDELARLTTRNAETLFGFATGSGRAPCAS